MILICRFLQCVAYRNFTWLIHGILGKKRIPLPACAYHQIRKKFPSETLVGYEDEIYADSDE